MPAICRHPAFSRSTTHEQMTMKTGAEALIRTALIAVVLSRPR